MRPTARSGSRSGRTRSYRFQVLIAARAGASLLVLLLFLGASLLLDLESNLNSESILEAPMASVHRRFACDGEAGGLGGGAAGAWRPQAAPSRRAGTMISGKIT